MTFDPYAASETPWHGGRVSPYATVVLAANPGPMTLEGTNTWVLRAPESNEVIVVDPGPDDSAHVQAVWAEATRDSGRVARIVLTHTHADHAGAAPEFSALAGVPVEAVAYDTLTGGDTVSVRGIDLDVIPTPGHTPDSVSLHLRQDGALITGDTVLGRGTTVVSHPEGKLADYLASIARLRALAQSVPGGLTLYPAHAAPLPDADQILAVYEQHRADRLAQVREAVESGLGYDADAVVAACYADAPAGVLRAARLSVLAQFTYLQEVSAPGE
ncbi:MAG: MBL fold metallo-hydrolase [Dermatophilus congolensis]|nr:MBL fold metallo-hydrolase [Dermatophilus congolensis]